LTSIHERKNEFKRPAVANINKMLIVASAAIPVTDPFLIDRMTVIAQKNDCEAIVCINKYDLDTAKLLYDTYSTSGFKAIRTSAETGEGISELRDAISGGICALTGNSGVGKSSILNMLDPEFSISVGGISKKLGRGRHTTRHVELYSLQDGTMLADTPGFSAFDTDYIAPKEEIQRFFPDFEPFIGACRFQDCAHIKEPGCTLLEAVDAGEVKASRHGSYVRLYEAALFFSKAKKQ
jgi:ribosome biogenesis GTPase